MHQPADARDFTIWTSFKKIRFTRILVLLEFTKSHPAGDRYNPPPLSGTTLGPPGSYPTLKQKVRVRPFSYVALATAKGEGGTNRTKGER